MMNDEWTIPSYGGDGTHSAFSIQHSAIGAVFSILTGGAVPMASCRQGKAILLRRNQKWRAAPDMDAMKAGRIVMMR